jgi:hypothetical protein
MVMTVTALLGIAVILLVIGIGLLESVSGLQRMNHKTDWFMDQYS